ncbi:MAG: GNAT family N-acetyltransferase [Proteobacteria bacterium]|nr:MAG: GNAT family N-acetyltransferase [Pseudomonadota bacterium]
MSSLTLVDPNFAAQDFSLINPIMRPEEIRSGDPVYCSIHSDEGRKRLKLWSYCPFGFEFLNDSAQSIHIGDKYKFTLVLGKSSLEVGGTVVYSNDHKSGEKIIGIRLNYESFDGDIAGAERRSTSRWNCPEHLLPSGTAPNPTRYNDFIFFRVIDISSTGFKIATSLRNKLVSVGQILDCTLSVPMIGSMFTAVKINRVGIQEYQGKEMLILGVSIISKDEVVLSTLSEYLLTFAEDCSVKSLRDAGFDGSLSSSNFDFSYSKSSSDYEQVIDLRFEAYKESGKVDTELKRDFMIDEFDSRSRILTVKLGSKLVGSARAMFHDPGDRTSHERYLSYPGNFPPIDQCLEVSRVCVRPDFQGVGLARELAKHMALLTIKGGRRYIFLSAAGTLVEFWKELGFKETGVTYIHKQLGNLEHKLLLNDIQCSILGKNISPSAWKESFEHLYDYCLNYGLIEPSLIDSSRILAFKCLNKIL